MPDLTIDDINKAVKDSAFAAVGFGVLSLQRAQVRRRELTEQLHNNNGVFSSQIAAARGQLAEVTKLVEEQVAPARQQLVNVAKLLDEQVTPVRKQIDVGFDELESRLPASARNVFASVRSTAQVPEAFLRHAVGLNG